MKQRTFRIRRRVGAALLAGVTALGVAGVAAVAGGGVASASTTVVASAATATTSLGSNSAAPGSAITLSLSGTITSGDTIDLVLACPSSGTVSFTAASTLTPTAVSASLGSPVTNYQCGSGVNNVLPINITSTPASGTSPSLLVTPTYNLSGVPAGSLSITGIYDFASGGTQTFSVPSDLTVSNVVVTPQTPLSIVSSGTGDASIGNISIQMPANNTVAVNGYVCLTLTTSNVNFDTIGGLPTVTQTNGSSNATLTSTAGVTQVNAAVPNTTTVSFQQVQQSSLNPPTFQIANLHVDVQSAATNGVVQASVLTGTNNTCSASATTLVTDQTVFAVGSAAGAAIYGQTPQATTAAEFEKAFVSTSGSTASCTNNGTAVIATSADPYDALAAAYLEGQLNTGVLITPPTSLDASTAAALKMAGVQRVYVVGGPDAVSQSVISQLQSTPAYYCGGLTPTNSNIVVEPSIYGTTADGTAVAIDNYITGNGQGGVSPFALPSLASAFANASTYNQTSGNASTTAPTGTPTTAIVVANTDWQDATAAAGIAYKYHLPVILTPGSALGSQASAELTKLGVTQVIALGGPLALSNSVVTSIQAINVNGAPISVLRIAGADKTQTAADLAMFEGAVLGWANTTVYVAQGSYWSDALGAAALSANHSSAVLETEGPTSTAGQYTDAVLTKAGTPSSGLGGGLTTSIQVLGGPLAVTPAQISEMQQALAAG